MDNSKRPIFVLGSARSGTSIVTKAIKSGAKVPGFAEGHFLPLLYFLMDEVNQYYEKRRDWNDLKALMLFRAKQEKVENGIIQVFRDICNSLFEDDIWIDKTPDSIMIDAAPFLLRAWSQSRFIFVKRRGLECISSRMRKFPNVSFETHCGIWKLCMEGWLNVRGSLNDQYIEIEQREISINPNQIATEISEFLGFTNEELTKISSTFSNERPEYTGGIEDVEAINIDNIDWSNEQKRFFINHCGFINEKFGYSCSSTYYICNPN